MYVCMYVCIYIYIYIYIYVNVYACIYIYIYIYVINVCMYTCNECMYLCMYVCMYACMHACMYVHTYVCTYVRMYVYITAWVGRNSDLGGRRAASAARIAGQRVACKEWSFGRRYVCHSIWACAKSPLASFDRKGDHLTPTAMHTRCIPDACPEAVITFT